MTRVIVTGGNGFVGRHAAEALVAMGFEVHVLGRSANASRDVEYHRLDLLDQAAVGAKLRDLRATHLVHAAWVTEHRAYWTSPANLDWVGATLDLVKAFASHGGTRVLTVGTCAEYDWAALDADDDCRETGTIVSPATLYGAAKLACSNLLGSFSGTNALSHAHARLFFLYGEDEQPSRLVPTVIRSLDKGEPARTTTGEQLRDFMDSRDAGRALALLAMSKVEGPANIGSGLATPVRDIARTVAKLMDRQDLLMIGALQSRSGEPPRIVADISVLRDATHFEPKFDLKAGLGHAIEWWRGQASHR